MDVPGRPEIGRGRVWRAGQELLRRRTLAALESIIPAQAGNQFQGLVDSAVVHSGISARVLYTHLSATCACFAVCARRGCNPLIPCRRPARDLGCFHRQLDTFGRGR
jgi:hypothetical protein